MYIHKYPHNANINNNKLTLYISSEYSDMSDESDDESFSSENTKKKRYF